MYCYSSMCIQNILKVDESTESLVYNINSQSIWLASLVFSNWILVLIFSNRPLIVKWTKLDEAISINFDIPLNTEKILRDFYLPLVQNSEVLLVVTSPHGYFELLREYPLSETKHTLLLRTQIILLFIPAQLAVITICYSKIKYSTLF